MALVLVGAGTAKLGQGGQRKLPAYLYGVGLVETLLAAALVVSGADTLRIVAWASAALTATFPIWHLLGRPADTGCGCLGSSRHQPTTITASIVALLGMGNALVLHASSPAAPLLSPTSAWTPVALAGLAAVATFGWILNSKRGFRAPSTRPTNVGVGRRRFIAQIAGGTAAVLLSGVARSSDAAAASAPEPVITPLNNDEVKALAKRYRDSVEPHVASQLSPLGVVAFSRGLTGRRFVTPAGKRQKTLRLPIARVVDGQHVGFVGFHWSEQADRAIGFSITTYEPAVARFYSVDGNRLAFPADVEAAVGQLTLDERRSRDRAARSLISAVRSGGVS